MTGTLNVIDLDLQSIINPTLLSLFSVRQPFFHIASPIFPLTLCPREVIINTKTAFFNSMVFFSISSRSWYEGTVK